MNHRCSVCAKANQQFIQCARCSAKRKHDFIWTQALLDPKQEREACGNWFSIWKTLRAQL